MLNNIEKSIENILENEGMNNATVIVTDIEAKTFYGNNLFKYNFVYRTNKGRGNGKGYYDSISKEVYNLAL